MRVKVTSEIMKMQNCTHHQITTETSLLDFKKDIIKKQREKLGTGFPDSPEKLTLSLNDIIITKNPQLHETLFDDAEFMVYTNDSSSLFGRICNIT